MQKIKYRLVHNRKHQLNGRGAALIQIELLLQQRKMYISSNIYIPPEQWDKRSQSIINHPNAEAMNAMIYEYIIKLESIELGLWKRGISPTLTLIREALRAECSPDISFEAFCRNIIRASNRTSSTKSNLLTTVKALNEYRPRYSWDDLTYTFVKEFDVWLKQRGAATNTAAKHLRNLRTLINEAISAGYIQMDKNPFRNFKIVHEKTQHRFLSPQELRRMETVKTKGRLAHVRDAFLFCCYTGLRFSDFIRLTDDNITNSNGTTWLELRTQKTNYNLKIPISLLFEGKAISLIQRYSSVKSFAHIGCNSDTNKQLAILQEKAKIKTRTTFHTARHTCATILCHQGVPITTVQKLLGHTKISTTQLYSEVMAETIVNDLKKVAKKKGKKPCEI